MGAPIDLNWIRAFAAVHQTGSFSRAAKRLGVPRSTVSRAVAALEDCLGRTLFHRTTRRVMITTDGKSLFDRTAASLTNLESALGEAGEDGEAPAGVLRITATVDVGSSLLAETVTRFIARYPEASVDVHLSSEMLDLAREGFDMAVRISAGGLRGQNLIARKVGVLQIQLYASPGYLARHSPLRSPIDLDGVNWVSFRNAPFTHLFAGSRRTKIDPHPRVLCDDMFFTREVLRQGGGIGALPNFLADADLAQGTLVRVLPRWIISTGTVYLVYPPRRHVPTRVTAFRDLLLEVLRQRPLLNGAPPSA